MIKLKRVHDTPGPSDGLRFLVERLGLSIFQIPDDRFIELKNMFRIPVRRFPLSNRDGSDCLCLLFFMKK